MKEFEEGMAYSHQYMKEKLYEKFGDKIIITEINGKANVVTFRTTAKVLLHDFYSAPKADDENEKLRLVKTAAAMIRNDIKTTATASHQYTSSDDIASVDRNLDFFPQSLQILLRTSFSEKEAEVKIASIGRAIVQAARPRVVIAPLQIGLGIQMHHHFGSRYLINVLSTMGYTSSYTEVKKFEANAAISQSTDIPGYADSFLQYMADNVDHNSDTLDGHNTYHGMGIIATTPGTSRTKPVPRLEVTSEDVKIKAPIDIVYYQSKNKGFGDMTFEWVKKLHAPDCQEPNETYLVCWYRS